MEPMKPTLDPPLKCCGMNAEDNSQVLQLPLHLARVIGSYIETASNDELLQTNKDFTLTKHVTLTKYSKAKFCGLYKQHQSVAKHVKGMSTGNGKLS